MIQYLWHVTDNNYRKISQRWHTLNVAISIRNEMHQVTPSYSHSTISQWNKEMPHVPKSSDNIATLAASSTYSTWDIILLPDRTNLHQIKLILFVIPFVTKFTNLQAWEFPILFFDKFHFIFWYILQNTEFLHYSSSFSQIFMIFFFLQIPWCSVNETILFHCRKSVLFFWTNSTFRSSILP